MTKLQQKNKKDRKNLSLCFHFYLMVFVVLLELSSSSSLLLLPSSLSTHHQKQKSTGKAIVTSCSCHVSSHRKDSTKITTTMSRMTYNNKLLHTKKMQQCPLSSSNSKSNELELDRNINNTSLKNNTNYHKVANMYKVTGILSIIAWVTTAYVALSFHPDPKFADCTLRHNLLTMSQAFAFPLPILASCFQALYKCAFASTTSKYNYLDSNIGQRLNLGLAIASFWLAASSAIPKSFAFGYDLYSIHHKIVISTIHFCTGIFTLKMALKSCTIRQYIRQFIDSILLLIWKILGLNDSEQEISSSSSSSRNNNTFLFTAGTIGLLYFTIQPIIVPYPLATIPTILGKRLSRPASAFTLLGTIVSYCLKKGSTSGDTNVNQSQKQQSFGSVELIKSSSDDYDDDILQTLRNGLFIGSTSHLLLIIMKIIGVDGGGLLIPGRGLWEVYPAMIAVPFAAGVSLIVHAICITACLGDNQRKNKLK